jgi:hypothetical protein
MPADANIFQQYLNAPKSVLDYQMQYNQADAAKNALAQSALTLQKGQMDLANAADVNRQRNALRDAVTSGQIDLSNPLHAATALTLAPDVAPAMLKTVQESATSRALASKDTAQAGNFNAQTDAENLKTRIAKSDQAIKDIAAFKSPQEALASLNAHVAAGDLPPDRAEMVRSTIPTDPAQFPAWQLKMLQNIMAAKDQIALQVPDANSKLTNATHVQTTAMTQAGEDRRANQTDKRVRELNAVGDSSPDSEQQLNYWADVIRKGGTLPPGLARGPGGSAFVREATKRAAMGDTTPADMMANQAEFAGQKAGQRTLGTKQANIEMAATEAYNMMPIAVAASEKVDRTQYPMLNKVLLAAERGTGDTNVVQLAVATNSLVNSYSRAISPSGTPTVSDKDHAREILETAYAKGQYSAAVDMMKQEIEQARKSPAQVRANMRPGAKPEAAAPAPAAVGAVPPDIAAILQKHGGK